MARRPVAEEMEDQVLSRPIVEETGIEERQQRRSSRTARRDKEKEEGTPKRKQINLVYWTLPFFALVGAFALALAFHRAEAFLINDTRFHLTPSGELGQDPPNLKIEGLKRASKAEIMRVFDKDLGRSLYLFPIQKRRLALLAVDYVKQASVSRRWPSQIHISITEREPVAFAQINVPNHSPRFHLIDGDGVLLPIPRGEKLENFAVLTGLNGKETEDARKVRVQQMIAMMKEIGALSRVVSEVDVRDPANLQLTLTLEERAVMVRLGSKNFLTRLQNFAAHYPQIKQQRPDAKTFDLRIDDRITAVEGEPGG